LLSTLNKELKNDKLDKLSRKKCNKNEKMPGSNKGSLQLDNL